MFVELFEEAGGAQRGLPGVAVDVEGPAELADVSVGVAFEDAAGDEGFERLEEASEEEACGAAAADGDGEGHGCGLVEVMFGRWW